MVDKNTAEYRLKNFKGAAGKSTTGFTSKERKMYEGLKLLCKVERMGLQRVQRLLNGTYKPPTKEIEKSQQRYLTSQQQPCNDASTQPGEQHE